MLPGGKGLHSFSKEIHGDCTAVGNTKKIKNSLNAAAYP
jgi:hypothetical protein